MRLRLEVDLEEILSKIKEKLNIRKKYQRYLEKKEVEAFSIYKKAILSEVSSETQPCASALLDVYSKLLVPLFPFFFLFYSWKTRKRVGFVISLPFFKRAYLNKKELLLALLKFLGIEPLVKEGQLYLIREESLEVIFTKVSGIVLDKQSGSIGILGENPSLKLLVKNKGCIYAFQRLLPYILKVK